MPLVVSLNAREVVYFAHEDSIGNILGHSNFDGFDWAVGDLILFETGEVASIIEMPEILAFNWTDPVPLSIEDGLILISKVRADGSGWWKIKDWPELFQTEIERVERLQRQGCTLVIGCVLLLGLGICLLAVCAELLFTNHWRRH